jgi:CRP-like cAMP-binding protein
MMQDRIQSPVVKPSDQMGKEELYELTQLTLDETLRARSALDEHVCSQWSAKMRAHRDGRAIDARGQAWPPLLIVSDGDQRWLVDGVHRYEAALLAGLTRFQVIVVRGTYRDAMERSLSANLRSERKRGNDDKRLVVRRALLDETWRALSDARVAELCGVSQPFVSKLRRELLASGEITQLAGRIGADGRVYQADRISGRKPRTTQAAPPKAAERKQRRAPERAVQPETPALSPTPPIIRKREATLRAPAAEPIEQTHPAIEPASIDAPKLESLRGGMEPGSLRLLVAPSLERRHWYDVANDGVPLLDRSHGVLVVPQTRDLPHAVSHLMRQDIIYLGMAMLKDGSAWHLWGFDEAIAIPAAHSLHDLCAALNPLAAPWIVYAP